MEGCCWKTGAVWAFEVEINMLLGEQASSHSGHHVWLLMELRGQIRGFCCAPSSRP